jgi:hypothetical protein
MFGAIGAAFGCRALVRQLGGDGRTGWIAFWLVALASPMTVYALDFWEHAPGAALMVWAVVLLLDVVGGGPAMHRVTAAAGAGLMLGAAATMRTETFVVAFVATLASCVTLLIRSRSLTVVVRAGLAVVAGFGATFGAGTALERALGAPARSARAEGVVTRSDTLLDQVPDRVSEGLTTLLAPQATSAASAWLAGAVIVAGVLLAITWWPRREIVGVAGAFGAAAVLLAAQSGGLSFVPGALIAFPLAVSGLMAMRVRGPVGWVASAALAAYPLTWLFQYLGGAAPQWGGRYVLVPTLVLGSCGLVWLTDRARDPRGLFSVGALCLLVTAVGVAALVVRTHVIDQTFANLVARSEDVVATENGFFVREGMDAYLERRWLAASHGAGVQAVAELVAQSGLGTFAWVAASPDPPLVRGFVGVESAAIDVLGTELHVHSFRRAP